MKTMSYTNSDGIDFTVRYLGKGVVIVHNDDEGVDTRKVDIPGDCEKQLGCFDRYSGSIKGFEKVIAFARECYREETLPFTGHVDVAFSWDDDDGSVEIRVANGLPSDEPLGWAYEDDPNNAPDGVGADIMAAARKWAGWS